MLYLKGSCSTVTQTLFESALHQKTLPLVGSQGLQQHKASLTRWSFLFRICHHTAEAAALAASVGFPPIERDLQPACIIIFQPV